MGGYQDNHYPAKVRFFDGQSDGFWRSPDVLGSTHMKNDYCLRRSMANVFHLSFGIADSSH